MTREEAAKILDLNVEFLLCSESSLSDLEVERACEAGAAALRRLDELEKWANKWAGRKSLEFTAASQEYGEESRFAIRPYEQGMVYLAIIEALNGKMELPE